MVFTAAYLSEARNMLRIRLPPLPLSRHRKGPKSTRLICLRSRPGQSPLHPTSSSCSQLPAVRLVRFILPRRRRLAQPVPRSQPSQRRPGSSSALSTRLLQDEQHHSRKILRLQRIRGSRPLPPARSPIDDAYRSSPAPAECTTQELRRPPTLLPGHLKAPRSPAASPHTEWA